MGGDRAPEAVVQGALAALAEYPEVSILLVGQEAVLQPLLKDAQTDRLTVVPASQVVGMDEHPSQALRRKKDSSIAVCAHLMKEGKATAVVSAGNTGAVIAAVMFAVRLLPGVHRPGIAVSFPTTKGTPALLCDVGANIHCKTKHYLQYALMASAYCEYVLGIKEPRVGLLNIGTEESKGSSELRSVRQEMKRVADEMERFEFVGAVEGNHIFEGEADVIVCDGFTGNTVLKSAEGASRAVVQHFASFVKGNGFTPEERGALDKAFKSLYAFTHYSEYGGAPLLGINGCAIIAHGRSDANAIKNAIRVARDYARRDVNQHIANRVGELPRVISS
jgi:glycerol-3-phosphate acyltransferase PlsX